MAKRNCVLFASFPKSGYNFSGDILGYVLIKKYTGKYEMKYEGTGNLREQQSKPYRLFFPADSRAAGQRKIRELFPDVAVDYCLHTHGGWKDSPLWHLDQARTVFIVRNIPTALYSDFKTKSQIKTFTSFRHYLEDGALERIIRFFSTWGRFCRTDGVNFRIFKYEELRTEPMKTFSGMYEYVFGHSCQEELLREALDFFSFDKQKNREYKISNNENQHFHFRGGTDYTDQIPAADLALIYTRIHHELTDTFGYEYPKCASAS